MTERFVVNPARVRDASAAVRAASDELETGRVDTPIGGLDGLTVLHACQAASMASVQAVEVVAGAWESWAGLSGKAVDEYSKTDRANAAAIGGTDGTG